MLLASRTAIGEEDVVFQNAEKASLWNVTAR